MVRAIILTLGLCSLAGCSFLNNLVYKIDIPQGNFIDEKNVEKLRVGMTKEQVSFVLGTPMSNNPFDGSQWYYVYRYKTGSGELLKKTLIAEFDTSNQLKKITGDFEVSEQFNVPIEQDIPDWVESQPIAPKTTMTPKESSLWSIKLGEFTDQVQIKRLKIQLEQAGYQVYLFPENPSENEKVSIYAAAGTSKEELVTELKAITQLTKINAKIARLPES